MGCIKQETKKETKKTRNWHYNNKPTENDLQLTSALWIFCSWFFGWFGFSAAASERAQMNQCSLLGGEIEDFNPNNITRNVFFPLLFQDKTSII